MLPLQPKPSRSCAAPYTCLITVQTSHCLQPEEIIYQPAGEPIFFLSKCWQQGVIDQSVGLSDWCLRQSAVKLHVRIVHQNQFRATFHLIKNNKSVLNQFMSHLVPFKNIGLLHNLPLHYFKLLLMPAGPPSPLTAKFSTSVSSKLCSSADIQDLL